MKFPKRLDWGPIVGMIIGADPIFKPLRKAWISDQIGKTHK